MSDRRGGCLTALLLVLSVSLVIVGGGFLYLVATGRMPLLDRSEVVSSSDDQVLRPGDFADYDWEELAYVAWLIAEAPSDEEGVNTAREWGVEVGDVRPLSLTDGRQASMTVVGIRCDERSDGTGRAGLTLMVSPISIRPMNESGSNEGGWEASSLRAWLKDDGLALLPTELAEEVASVRKSTNNIGIASDHSCVTATDDRLWLFSLSEVAGEIDLFANEYGDEVRERTYYIDYGVYDEILSAEGEQYPYFREAGVTCSSDSNGVLALEYGSAPTAWWYRSPYPVSFEGEKGTYFYQVMDTGYPSSLGSVGQGAGVTVGLCL